MKALLNSRRIGESREKEEHGTVKTVADACQLDLMSASPSSRPSSKSIGAYAHIGIACYSHPCVRVTEDASRATRRAPS